MKEITIEVTDDKYRLWVYALRKLYGKDKRTGLNRLAELAIRKAVLEQLKQDCCAAEALL